MTSSGTTPMSTAGSSPVALLPAVAVGGPIYRYVTIINGGTSAGFFSLDSGTTWCRLLASSIVQLDHVSTPAGGVLVMRDPNGSVDLTGLYAYAY